MVLGVSGAERWYAFSMGLLWFGLALIALAIASAVLRALATRAPEWRTLLRGPTSRRSPPSHPGPGAPA